MLVIINEIINERKKTPPPAQNEFLKRVNYCNFIILSVSPRAITSINASKRV